MGEQSQSFRIVWLLEELGMEYELKVYQRQADTKLAPPEYKKLSPLGTSPTIVVDDGTTTLCESNAIIDYILDLAEKKSESSSSSTSLLLRPGPSDEKNCTAYLFWFHAAQGTFQPMLSNDSLLRMIPTRVPWFLRPMASLISSKTRQNFVQPRLERYLSLAESVLTKQNYFVGSDLFTAADITSIYPMDAVFRRYPNLSEQYPRCWDWYQRVSEREAFQTASTKVGGILISADL